MFTYGTLQDAQVQRYVFNKVLEGEEDFLPGFKWFENAIYGRYPLVKPTFNVNDTVKGIAYKVTELDLTRCDIYETAAYQRKKFILKSGKEAWVYIENSK